MDKTDLHSQLNHTWRQVFTSMLIIAVSAPPAIIPWLKDMGIVSPDNTVARWLWRFTPDINQMLVIRDFTLDMLTVVLVALGVLVFGIYRFSKRIKSLETLESFKDEAEKRLRVEGYMQKERAIIQEKGK